MEYPEEEQLQRIRKWDYHDPRGWFDYIKSIWNFADWGWDEVDSEVECALCGAKTAPIRISTAGWSGNEDIIRAMRKNRILWSMTWESSRKGGHYTFSIA